MRIRYLVRDVAGRQLTYMHFLYTKALINLSEQLVEHIMECTDDDVRKLLKESGMTILEQEVIDDRIQ
jgi:hypothetical protein